MPSPSLSNRFGQATGDAPIVPIVLIMIGAYLAWFGAKYWEDPKTIWPSDPIKDVLQGKGLPSHATDTTTAIELTAAEQQAGAAQSAAAASGGSGGGSGGGTSGAAGSPSAIAQSYVGKLTYVFGGPPPSGTVDCSSFASKVLHQAGYSSPGGQPYSSSSHGPTTISYLSWNGATTIGHSASDALENDLCVWQTHMGICIGGGKMVSARDSQEGVGEDNIAGDMPNEVLFVRRLKATSGVA
jgi:cell wall-associated NlpC family hydrolase